MKRLMVFITALFVATNAQAVDTRTAGHIADIDPELKAIVEEVYATCDVDFRVIDGMRTMEEQIANVKKGVSLTLKSKHLHGDAIDFAPATFDWNDIASYKAIGQCFKDVAGDKIIWGGDWNWKDWGHIQLKG